MCVLSGSITESLRTALSTSIVKPAGDGEKGRAGCREFPLAVDVSSLRRRRGVVMDAIYMRTVRACVCVQMCVCMHVCFCVQVCVHACVYVCPGFSVFYFWNESELGGPARPPPYPTLHPLAPGSLRCIGLPLCPSDFGISFDRNILGDAIR